MKDTFVVAAVIVIQEGLQTQSYFSFISEDLLRWDTVAIFFLHYYYRYLKS